MAAKAKRIKKSSKAVVAQAMDQLVGQFSQPLAFLRELIQNSLDASTNIVEVEVGLDKQDDHCYIQVKDTGVGMDRAVIDNKLTCLFSSSKEDDLTKIGKFGIGFVSIFAINPTLVVLDTGKDGQSWRLLFKPDRSFERRELDVPIEGTCITVYLDKPREKLAKLQADCRDTVSFWCRHASVEILFNGQKINKPFELPMATFSYRLQTDNTEVVVAPSLDKNGFAGYYNAGLTLLEKRNSPLPYVDFKLCSNFLEHTLTRDNIIQDSNYEKAMAQVQIAAYQKMPLALLDKLAKNSSPELWQLARVLRKYPDSEAILSNAAIFPSKDKKLKRSELSGAAFIHPKVDDFWLGAEAAGVTIIQAQSGNPCLQLLEDLGRTPISLAEYFVHFQLLQSSKPLEEKFLNELEQNNKSLPSLKLITVISSPPYGSPRFCYPIAPNSTVTALGRSLNPRDHIGINHSHDFWATLLSLYKAQPELAIALATRKISLALNLGTRADLDLFSNLIKNIRKL